ncbi:MAG: hypothetical protein J6S36_03645 [Eggerthellaceae bacterium]|nr:hypothetical protein [Eggerthellaceae bacterium]
MTRLTVDREKTTSSGTVYKVKASWEIPDVMSDTSRPDHATFINAECDLDWTGAKNPESVVYATQNQLVTVTKYNRYFIKGLGMGTSFEKVYDRSRYYPVKKDQAYTCNQIRVAVHGGNDSGAVGTYEDNQGRGPITEMVYKFLKPRKPEVSVAYNQSNSTVTVTVTSDAGEDQHERYDTVYRVYIRKQDGKEAVLRDWTSTQNLTATYSVDLSTYLANMADGKYVRVYVEAYSRGMAGDSAITTVYRSYGKPGKASIKSITVDRKAAGGVISVAVSASWLAAQVKLQRRHGASGSWSDVSGAVDDSDVQMLYDTWGDAAPVDGEYIYYRVVSTRDQFTTESSAKRADALYTAKPKAVCDSTVGIISTNPAKAGTSCTIVAGFTDAESYSSSQMHTEISWSDRKNAWTSTDAPDTHVVDGNGSASTSDYNRQQSVTISSLVPGTTYYVRARRYREVDGETVYSRYSPTESFMTESATDDTCGFMSISCNSDGTRATIVLGITEDNANTGTQITWADHKDAWQSNEQPESFNATWAKVSAGTGAEWTSKQTIYLRGLKPGTTYWVKARRYLESTTTTYGAWSKLGSFTTPTATVKDLRCGLPSATAGEDGHSIRVVIGWAGEREGNEVSWSQNENAWESNDAPETMTLEWEDEENASTYYAASTDTSVVANKTYYTRSGSSGAYVYTEVSNPSGNPSTSGYYEKKRWWGHTATAYITGLETGETYYVRTRTYVGDRWSPYSVTRSVTPYVAPESVTLTAPPAVARGKDIEIWWSISGELDQKKWRVRKEGATGTSLVSGNGSLCRAIIPASRYGNSDNISFHVESSCGGGYTSSDTVTVGIVDKPTCSVVGYTIIAQPAEFTVETDNPGATLLCTCRSNGITQQLPDGTRDQLEGDVIWTAVVEPTWTLSGSSYFADVTMPMVDFVDTGLYTITVKAVEPLAGMASDAATATVVVDWAQKAVAPSSDITITPDIANRCVTISLDSAGESTDAYDVYRKTPTGYDLIAYGLAQDAEVLDRFAPFGKDADLYYRIALRTLDGDIRFMDYPYQLPVDVLRFDWFGGSLELPYNLGFSESWKKSFETRAHVDGTVNGYWEKAVELTGSYSTDLIRLDDLSQYEIVNQLGEHAGAVFCRTVNGMAFQCDVQPRDVSMSYKTQTVSTRLDVTRVALTEDFTTKNGEGA